MQGDQPVCRPGDGIRLSRARRMLDQIVATNTLRSCVFYYLEHRVDLVEARENQCLLTFLFFQVDEAPDDVEEDITRENRPALGLIRVQVGDTKLPSDVGVARTTL